MPGKTYTKFPNEMITALGTLNLTSYEQRVFWWIVGKTFMWRRARTYVNATAASRELNIQRQHFRRALSSLDARNIVALKTNGKVKVAQVRPASDWLSTSPVQGRLNFKQEAV